MVAAQMLGSFRVERLQRVQRHVQKIAITLERSSSSYYFCPGGQFRIMCVRPIISASIYSPLKFEHFNWLSPDCSQLA